MINLSLVKISSNKFEINLITCEILQDIKDFNLEHSEFQLKTEFLNENIVLVSNITFKNLDENIRLLSEYIKVLNDKFSLHIDNIEKWQIDKIEINKNLHLKLQPLEYLKMLTEIELDKQCTYSTVVNYNNECVFFNTQNKYKSLDNSYIKFSTNDKNLVVTLMLSKYYLKKVHKFTSYPITPVFLENFSSTGNKNLILTDIINDYKDGLNNTEYAFKNTIIQGLKFKNISVENKITNDISLLDNLQNIAQKGYEKKILYFIIFKLLSSMVNKNIKHIESSLIKYYKKEQINYIKNIFANIRKFRKNMTSNYSKYSYNDLFEELYNKITE